MAWYDLVRSGMFSLPVLRYLRPRQDDGAIERPRTAADLNIPRDADGSTLPLVYGTVRVRSPIVSRVGDFMAEPLIAGGNKIADDYFIAMRLTLCRGNSPLAATTGGASLVAFFVGDKRVTLYGPPMDAGIVDGSSHQSYRVTAPGVIELPEVDGDVRVGAAVLGVLYFYRGRFDQVLHTSDLTETEHATYTTPRRGRVAISLAGTTHNAGGKVLHWHLGPGGDVPLMSAAIHNPITIPGYEAETAPIGTGDANPIAILYDLLTNPLGGLGYGPAIIDLPSFAAAAQTLQDEGHGMSLEIARDMDARAAIDLVLSQIDGGLREEPGSIEVVLIRDDYTLGSLPILNEANIEGEPDMGATLLAEAVTEVKVTYVNSAKDWIDDSETARDDALLNALGGKRNPQTWDYPGCSNQPLAAKLAARQLHYLSRPLRSLSVTVKRSAGTLRFGDPFRFQWAAYGASGVDIVFRVSKVNVGTLEDGSVRIEAIQDRFTAPGSLWQNEQVSDQDVGGYARPILLRTITEAPRWVMLKAFEAGAIANVDAQRGYYLARPEGVDDRYRVDTDDGGDLAARSFPGRFELDDIYLRTAGPYDTTGIQIRSVAGWTPTSATATQIATEGRNLIQIDDEILAFETATHVSGSTWTLDNVWRGVLDTVPADHAESATGYVLPGSYGTGAMGSKVLVHGIAYEARTLAATSWGWTPAAESPTDTLTARSRVRLPYPVDNLTVNGSQAPAELSDDGVTMTWAKRDRTKGTITRPDATTETPEAGTAYHAVGYKGTGPLDGGTQVTLQAGITSGTNRYPLGAVGHGALEVGVDSALAVTLPDGTTPTLTAWQVPTLEVIAPRHRNLLINGKFDDASNNWTITAGTASTGSGAGSLGGGGTMITAASGTTTLTFHQDVPIQGYDPADLRALLSFAAGPTGADANDTFEVTLESRDSHDNVLDTATIAATHPAAWDRYSVEIANLDPDTAYLRVAFSLAIATSGDGGDTHVDIGVTECRLRVGDFTGQLLSNNEFASGTTSWTASVGTWATASATLYDCAQYLKPNDAASAQLRQAITPAAGWERNATAELVCGRMNDAVDDTGAVVLQALDSGGSVIGSSTTGAEASTALGGTNVWAPRRLTLDLPSGTVTVRVQLDATRVTGTPLNVCFGSFDLRLHKELDPVVDLDHVFDSPPTQRLPASHAEWVSAWPNIAPPNAALYAGRANGELGNEPLLEVVGAAYTDGEFLCDEGRPDGRLRTKAYDLVGGSVRVGAVGDSFLNFRSTENWCVGVAYKSGVWTGSESGLIARVDATNTLGWELGLDAGGRPNAILWGATSNTTVVGTSMVGGEPGPAVLRIVYLHHDAATDEITIVDDVTATSVTTAGVGEFRGIAPTRPTIGASGNFPELNGQIARIWAWRGANTPSVADLQSTIDYATNPTGVTDGNPRTGYVVTVDGSDADGLVARGWPVPVLPHVLDEELGGVGILACPSCTNLVYPDFAGWSVVGTPAIEVISDPLLGLRQGRAIASASGDGLRSPTIAFGAAATVYFTVAYCSPDGTATFHLENNSGTSVASYTLPHVATPTVVHFQLSWTGATSGNGKLRITSGSTGRAVRCSSVMYAGLTEPMRRTIPIGTPGAICPSVLVSPTSLYNAEGELYADVALVTQGTATIARAWNATNTNDNRQLRLVSGNVVGKHSTGAGTNTDAATSLVSVDTSIRYQARLRWQRVGLRDGTSSEYSSARAEQGATVEAATGRTADWTPSATALQIVDLGHDDGSDVATGVIGRVRLRAREPRL